MQALPVVAMLCLEGEDSMEGGDNLHHLFTTAENSDDPKVRDFSLTAVNICNFSCT